MKTIIASALASFLILSGIVGCKTMGAIKEDFNSIVNNSPDESTETLVVPSERRQLVQEVQTMLAGKGYAPGAIDGQAGPLTYSALRAFQTARGLPISNGVTQEVYIQLASDKESDSPSQRSQEDTRECVQNFKKQGGLRNYRTNATLNGVSKGLAMQRLERALGRKGFVINENDGSRGYINGTYNSGSSNIQISAFIKGGTKGSNVELNYAGTGASWAIWFVPASAYRNELCEFIDAMQTGGV